MIITKPQGVLISLLIMIPYVLFYYGFVRENPYSLQLTSFFLVGIFLHFLRQIEPGTRAELVFRSKATGFFWSDGLVLVPTIFPILHIIDIYLLWNLKKVPTRMGQHMYGEMSHFRDQRLPEYHVRTNTSFLVLQFSRILGEIWNFFVSVDRRFPELIYQKVGFKIVVAAILAGAVINFTAPKTITILRNTTSGYAIIPKSNTCYVIGRDDIAVLFFSPISPVSVTGGGLVEFRDAQGNRDFKNWTFFMNQFETYPLPILFTPANNIKRRICF